MDKAKQMVELLLIQLDECFSGSAWHGANLYGTLESLDVQQALHESADGFSAWKIALHCAYWKYRVRRKLNEAAGVALQKFERSPADWPRLPATLGDANWRSDLAFLQRHHEALRAAIVDMAPSLIFETYGREGRPYHRLIVGAAAHDAYHAAHVRNIGIPRLR
jgi:hypothetical protein